MANNVKVNYLSKDYNSIRRDLVNFLKAYFPEQWQDFNVASPGMAMLELNAYIADQLSFAVDSKFNQLFIDGIKNRKNAYRLAKTLGYKVPGNRPALSVVDFTIEVPATADGPDINYLPVFRPGTQVRGGGQVFETTDQVDFSSDFSEEGIANRTFIPILNSNQDIIRYRVRKREKIKAGTTKIYKREVIEGEQGPFFQITLPEKNVLEITSIIIKNGVGLSNTPTYQEFNDYDLRFWEVDSLAQDKIFVDVDSDETANGTRVGDYLEVEKRFTKEFLADGSCRITFGGGVEDYDAYDSYLTELTNTTENPDSTSLDLGNILDNTALGVSVQPNTTIYVQYRIGGGPLSNVGTNVLNSVSNINAVILGDDPALNQAVLSSTIANNPIPAIGGAGLPTVNEIKQNIAAHYSAQDRCVTLEDYISRCYQMPGRFGAPFRIYGKVEDNKIKLYILTRDGEGKLVSISTSVVKQNLANYLSAYRMVNDFVEINDGKVINLQFEVDLHVDKSYNSSEIKSQAIDTIADFMDVDKWQMKQSLFLSQIVDELREIPGVVNVVDLRVYNVTGGLYSTTTHIQAIGESQIIQNNGEIKSRLLPISNAIEGDPISMFEVKFPEKDILVRVG
jgi:hypothetical protein